MSSRLLCLSAVSALVISACATSQENPNYAYSTKYKASSPYAASSQSPTTVTTQPAAYVTTAQTQPAAPVVYQAAQTQPTATPVYTRTNHECLRKETNRELAGGAIGGTLGAIAGKKLIGGTKGTVIGAAVGGTAGYGIGDKSINCDPIQVPAAQTSTTARPVYPAASYPASQVQQTYQVPAQPQLQQQVQAPIGPHVQLPPQQNYPAPTDQAYGNTYGTPGYHAVMAAQQQAQVQPQQPAPQPQYIAPQPQYVAPQPAYTSPQPQPVYAAPQPVMTQASANLHEVVEGDTVYSMAKRLCVPPQDIQRINNLDANFSIKLGEYIQLPAPRC